MHICRKTSRNTTRDAKLASGEFFQKPDYMRNFGETTKISLEKAKSPTCQA